MSLAMVLALGAAAQAQFGVETKLTALDVARSDLFGISVGISGDTAIVGSIKFSDLPSSGSAYLFDVNTGNQLFKLTSSDPYDDFGYSVAISGFTAIVGADRDDGASIGAGADFGAAFVFNVTTGEQLFKLTASDAAEQDQLGRSLAISGTTAILGAHGDDHAGNRSGSAYLFDVNTGHQLFKLTADDAAGKRPPDPYLTSHVS